MATPLKVPFNRIKGIIPTDPPAPALYDHLASVIRTFAVSPEAVVRTLAWLTGAVIASADLAHRKQQRLIDLVVDDVALIVAGAGDDEET